MTRLSLEAKSPPSVAQTLVKDGSDSGHPSSESPAPKRQKTQDSRRRASSGRRSSTKQSILTDGDKEKLREWLNKREEDPNTTAMFTVVTGPVPKTRKGKPYTGPKEQLSLGGKDHLAVAYSVSPATQWNQLNKYKKFTLPSGETHEIGSCVYVKHIDSENDTLEPEEQWKAQVLEVRALDENHVYLRVVWLENPTELPVGEKPYHGKHELIASNEMAIIDAMTVNGGLDVVYWDEEKDDEAMPDPDVYFWRQTYDRRTGALSKLRQICKCGMPHNPDHMIVWCKQCMAWLHDSCIIEDAKQQATSEANGASDPNATKKSPKTQKSDAIDVSEAKSNVEVEITKSPSGKIQLVIKDCGQEDGDARVEEVHCLLCRQVVD